MKIAFASCMDAIDDPTQTVWDKIADVGPEVLLLLGDSVYMDFGILNHRRLGWPRKAGNEEFASTLYQRYALQWSVASFRNLAKNVKLGMTWDDHDFAWNNSRGAGSEKRSAVPRDKRLISRALFLQFQAALLDQSAAYPAMPPLPALLGTDDAGIQTSFDIGPARIIMLDGRSFREDPNDVPDAEMHGRMQREWLRQLLDFQGPKIICSGSVMSRSGESWDQYLDYSWLLEQPARQMIVLTGDIHKNVAPVRHARNVYEITSSGAARPGFGGNSGNFGVLNLDAAMSVTLYSGEMPNGSQYPLTF